MSFTAAQTFIAGAIFMGTALMAAIFFRFYKKTEDALFAYFTAAFSLLAIERIILAWTNALDEVQAGAYCIRLFAFGLIIFAVVQKNREARGR